MSKDYQYNKAPKDTEFNNLVRNAFNKDRKENGFSKDEAAHELGMTYNTLDQKLRPSHPSDISMSEYKHHLEITGRYESLHLFTSKFGFELKAMNIDTSCSSTSDIGSLVDKAMIEFSETFKIVKESSFDDVISQDERIKIKKEANEAIEVLQQMLHDLDCMKDED